MGREENGYEAFAAAHGLERIGGYEVGLLTPLLAEGREGQLAPAVRGRLPGGIDGVVGFLAYERDKAYRFNLALTEVPESTVFVPRLFCLRRFRLTRDDGVEAFEDRSAKLWTESTALSERYEISTAPNQDENWLRQLFSPEFVDWLANEPPSDFSFELAYGLLVGSIEENHPDLAEFDALCEATARVAARIRGECEE